MLNLLMLPTFVSAAFENVSQMITDAGTILGMVYRMVFSLALLFFMWGMGQFILKAGDQKAREDGKQKMIWGIIAIFVMFSIYGIINWIGTALGISVGCTDPTAQAPGC